jgi:hypothetical protein
MRIGLVLTVKNEERLLRSNLMYHKALGIASVFVYFDNSTDGGRNSIENIEDVHCFNSVDADVYRDQLFLEKFTRQASTMHTARQCLNTFDALQRCKKAGIDWLLSMDADELFLPSINGELDLNKFLEKCKGVDVVRLSTMEVLGRQFEYDDVMAEETLFKSQSRFKHWNDRIYFDFYNPYTSETITHPAWLGHTMGKCAINVNSELMPKNVHRFKAIDNRDIKVVSMGYLLHYVLYDFKDFKKKFQNIKHRPDVFLNGKSLPKLPKIWRDMVNDPQFDDLYLKDYYKKNIFIDATKLKQFYSTRFLNILKRKEKAVVKITYVKELLSKF